MTQFQIDISKYIMVTLVSQDHVSGTRHEMSWICMQESVYDEKATEGKMTE